MDFGNKLFNVLINSQLCCCEGNLCLCQAVVHFMDDTQVAAATRKCGKAAATWMEWNYVLFTRTLLLF